MKIRNLIPIILFFSRIPIALSLVLDDGSKSKIKTYGNFPSINELECPDGVFGLKMEPNCGGPGYQSPGCSRTLLVQQSLDEGKLAESLQYADTDESRLARDILIKNGTNYDANDIRLSNCTHLIVEAMLSKQRSSKAVDIKVVPINVTLPIQPSHAISAYNRVTTANAKVTKQITGITSSR